MPIFVGSRYEGSRYTAFVDRDGVTRKYVHPRVPLTTQDLNGDFQIVGKQAGEELDNLCVHAGARERLWWVIAEVSSVQNALKIEEGKDLTVPSKTQFARFK